MRTLGTATIAGFAALAIPQAAAAAPPAPCNGAAQISDVGFDGHHPNTDVLGGWFSEANGRLQAVIRPRVADWAPAHDESAAAGWAMLFTQAGQTRFVRVVGPRGPTQFDFGTWTAPGGFAGAGATAGVTEAGGATIDVPGHDPGHGPRAAVRAHLRRRHDPGRALGRSRAGRDDAGRRATSAPTTSSARAAAVARRHPAAARHRSRASR